MASSSKQLGVGGWEEQTSWAPQVLQIEPVNPLPGSSKQWTNISCSIFKALNLNGLPQRHLHTDVQTRHTLPAPCPGSPCSRSRTPALPSWTNPPGRSDGLRVDSGNGEAEWCKLGRRWGDGGLRVWRWSSGRVFPDSQPPSSRVFICKRMASALSDSERPPALGCPSQQVK